MKRTVIPKWLQAASERIIQHMNEDHSKSIVSTLHAQHDIKDSNAKMENLATDGYFVLSKGKLLFLNFEKNCENVNEYKGELVKHANKYREYELSE
tara:strand:+ start:512 stop:799 length:288 start_codon:yes stop_codon:yes gene_type:complete